MAITQGIELAFNRNFKQTENTGLAKNFNDKLINIMLDDIDEELPQSELIAASFLNCEKWVLITLSNIYWKRDSDVQVLTIDNIETINIDLYAQKELVSGIGDGMRFMKAVMKNNQSFILETEPGQSAYALINIVQMIKNRQK